jgi:LuxR family transcriptional regulator, maltose regulon positive regulatory protein
MTKDWVRAGTVALREGRWIEARAAFERAVATGETPEGLEGLSWAAWWLDDAETVMQARERAFRLYRERGDVGSAGRMAIWLASDQLDFHGALAVANGWLARAQRLLAPLEPGPDHGWLAFHEGYIASLCGDFDRAEALGAQAAKLGRELGVPDLEMLGLALHGSTLVARARVNEGMRCLDEATAMALAGEAAIPIACAWACCFLVSACTNILDFQRAYEWCDRIAEFSERYDSRFMLAFCRAEYGAVHLWRGQWREADEMLVASVEDFTSSRPALVAGPLVALAELRRRQGRSDDAATLLDRAGAGNGAQVVRARLALDRGDATSATDLLERVLRQLPDHRELDRVPVLELLVRASIGTGQHEAADAALETLRSIQDRVDRPPMRALFDRAAGMLAAARGELARASALLADAVDRFEQSGAPFEAAIARTELAGTLQARGEHAAAERELALAQTCLHALGAVPEARRVDQLAGGPVAVAVTVTPRERDVLALLAEGLTNRAIGERLGVSEHTVHRHVTNILRKLELPSRAAAAAYAVRTGLVAGGT